LAYGDKNIRIMQIKFMGKSIYSRYHKHLVGKLKQARKEAGLSQRETAQLLKKTQSYLSKVEKGQIRIDFIQLKSFARIYGKNLAYFLEQPLTPFATRGEGADAGYLLKVQESGDGRTNPSAQEKFRELVETTSDIIWEVDTNWKYTYINPPAATVLGYSVAELIGKTPFDLMDKASERACRQLMEKTCGHGNACFACENIRHHKDGRRLVFETNANPVFDKKGRIIAVRGIDRDITNRKRLEEQLRLSEKKYHELVENSLDGVAIVQDNAVRFINTALEKMLGYTLKELAGRDYRDFLHPDSRRTFPRSRNSAPVFETSLIAKNGKEIAVEFSIGTIDYEGRPAFVSVLRDLTPRIKVRNQLREAKEKAENAVREKTHLLTDIAHEVRTAVNAIVGFSDLLDSSRLDPSQAEYLETIRESSEHILALFDEAIDLDSASTGKLRLDEINCNLHRLIEDIARLALPRAAKPAVKFHFSISSEVPLFVKADPVRIQQILIIMLKNAVRHTRQGAISVSVDATPSVDRDFRAVKITVSDTGSGIDAKVQGELKKLFAGQNTFVSQHRNLAMLRFLAEKMGGRVTFESQQNSGTSFSTLLQLEQSASGSVADTALARNPQIMVIAQAGGRNLARRLETVITDHGLEMDLSVLSQEDATTKLSASMLRPDFIFCKIISEEGLRFSEKISAILSGTNTRIVAILPNDAAAGFAKKAAALCKYVMHEDFNPSELMETVLDSVSVNAALSGRRILIAEDNPVNLRMLTLVLEKQGAEVTGCADGTQAVDKAVAQAYDYILMDIQMPVMDGLRAAKTLRAAGINTPIIALTACTMEEDREKAFTSGMNDYLIKPVNIKLLCHKMLLMEKNKAAGSRSQPL